MVASHVAQRHRGLRIDEMHVECVDSSIPSHFIAATFSELFLSV
jgi:hypothetical protein